MGTQRKGMQRERDKREEKRTEREREREREKASSTRQNWTLILPCTNITKILWQMRKQQKNREKSPLKGEDRAVKRENG